MKTAEEEDQDINGNAIVKEDFKTALRRKLFQIYNEMMAERNTDMSTAAVLLAIHFIQIYGLIYDRRLGFPFNDDIYIYLASICDVFRIYPLLETFSSTAYYGVAFGLLALLLVYLALLYLTDKIIEKGFGKMLSAPVAILSIASTLIYWVLMMPTIEVYVAIFDCDPNGYHHIDHTL